MSLRNVDVCEQLAAFREMGAQGIQRPRIVEVGAGAAQIEPWPEVSEMDSDMRDAINTVLAPHYRSPNQHMGEK